MKYPKIFFLMIFCFMFFREGNAQPEIKIGSKLFTESVLLGEIAKQLAESNGYEAGFFEQLGGTRVVWNALLAGEIDIYPEYTGTILQEILGDFKPGSREELSEKLTEMGIGISPYLGFNNTYAIGISKKTAQEKKLKTISDLKEHPELTFGFSNEFIDRADGWAGLKQFYKLDSATATGLDHDLAYRALESDDIQVIDLYSTDAEIEYYNIHVLEDDLNFFPSYQAVYLYRKELEKTAPKFIDAINALAGTLSERQIISMNAAIKLEGNPTEVVAARFLSSAFEIQRDISESTILSRVWQRTLEHFFLVGVSLSFALLVAIPLGIFAAKSKKAGYLIVSLTGLLQTIPALALLVFMIPLFGIGAVPAMAALFLYSLLPIVRNTHSGILGIDEGIRLSARALGVSDMHILFRVELPLASPTMLAGIKTAAVINVGTATLGALIGAGGYGQPILTGIRLDDVGLILEGAIPAAILAMSIQLLFDYIENIISKS